MKSYPLIGFEGPIAAGKTTLATMLAAHLTSALILEEFEHNDFLADFYSDRERWALPMQLWFLTARHAQLNSVSSFSKTVVADYTYLKDGIFASILLNGRELQLYKRLESELASQAARPDLIVYLDAADDVLLERIRQRNRPYEQAITGSYLDILRQGYDEKLTAVGIDLLRYDTSRLNLNSEVQMNDLYRTIVSAVRD